MPSQRLEVLMTGTPICRGIAIGHPFFLNPTEDAVTEYAIPGEQVEMEVARYRKAMDRALDEIRTLQRTLQKQRIFDAAVILDGHLQMMRDALLTTNVEMKIRNMRKNAEHIFQCIIEECHEKFNSIEDSFFRERFKDLQDISKRVLGQLRNSVRVCLADIPQNSIIISNDLTAFDTAEANSGCVCAFITREGGATSHAAIVAKAKGIPYVTSVEVEHLAQDQNGWVIVDGRTGEIILEPSPETLLKYQQLRDQLNEHMQKLKQTEKLEAETYDGYTIHLSANIEMIGELDLLHQSGGSGVGLFRTECAFLAKEEFPSEQEQYELYRNFVQKMNGLPIVIRTFDIGGDKYLRNQQTVHECNPFLGCRAIRFLLREKDIFKDQLRAILRASAFGEVKIMFPMVSALSELLEAKEILASIRQELIDQGENIPAYTPVGCMIEVPSAAIITDLLAKECDFLSIGTNDLVQYSLAVDRSNNALRNLYTPSHPSVIRLIRLVVNEANHHGIPVAVCGEVAADPRFTPLLLGLGVHELSVASRYIPVIKNAIRNTSIVVASKLAEQVLTLTSAAEIEALLTHEYRRNVPEDCFYNC